MKFQVTGPGWSCGDALAPPGTVFDYDNPSHWTARVARGVIPIDATPLDDEAAQAQQAAYPNHRHLLGHYSPAEKQKQKR